MPLFLCEKNGMSARNIYLVGLMGSGKTTIGKQLAKTLGMPFFDSDKEIEESTGVNIPTIFEYEGEGGFREREHAVIKQLSNKDGIVMATGGGAVIQQQNRDILKEHGFVVYLQCSIDKILQRTKRDKQRPLLNTENPKARLEVLFIERAPMYSECADYKIDTGIMPTRKVVQNIVKQFRAEARI